MGNYNRIDFERSPYQDYGLEYHDIYVHLAHDDRLRKIIARCYLNGKDKWSLCADPQERVWDSVESVCASLRRPYGIRWSKEEWESEEILYRPGPEEKVRARLIRALPSEHTVKAREAREIREGAGEVYHAAISPLALAFYPQSAYIEKRGRMDFEYGIMDGDVLGHAEHADDALEAVMALGEEERDNAKSIAPG